MDAMMTLSNADKQSSNLPQFVDKALKLFNLRQVALELETSVMSKVSCTACKAGIYYNINIDSIICKEIIAALLHAFYNIIYNLNLDNYYCSELTFQFMFSRKVYNYFNFPSFMDR